MNYLHPTIALIIRAHNEFRRSFEFVILAGQPFGTESIKYFAQPGTHPQWTYLS
jgi:hypothetical protein